MTVVAWSAGRLGFAIGWAVSRGCLLEWIGKATDTRLELRPHGSSPGAVTLTSRRRGKFQNVTGASTIGLRSGRRLLGRDLARNAGEHQDT